MNIRVINAGFVTPVYSQAIYHGIAEQMQADDCPVLVIMQPDKPYICIGLHQQLDEEVDLIFCEKNEIQVLRRHIGGGTVLLDENQLFFQYIFPKAKAPNRPGELYPYLLNPILHTYHHFGIPALLKSTNDIQVSNKKIGGTGAGTINNATVLVGSFMYDFNYHLMSQCIKAPSENFRASLEGILEQSITTMKAQLTKTPPVDALTEIFLANVADTIDYEIEHVNLTQREVEAIRIAEQEQLEEEWLYIDAKKLIRNGLKIAAGVYLLETTFSFCDNPLTIRIKYDERSLQNIWLESPSPRIQAAMIFVATELNITKPKVDQQIIYETIIKVTSQNSSLNDSDIEILSKKIVELATFTEY